MKIAILGSGFSGLATAWNLLQNHIVQIDLFDPNGIGGGASKMAAGLLHKYAGAHAKLNRFGDEGEKETKILLDVASKTLGHSVILSHGLLRLAIGEAKKEEFLKRAKSYPELQWQSAEECQKIAPGISTNPGIFIANSLSVDCEAYLQGLWKACANLGARFFQEKILELKQLSDYSAIVVAVGAHMHFFDEFRNLRVTQVKGQLLEMVWPNFLPYLSTSLNAEAYITNSKDPQIVVAGATFEKDFTFEEEEPEKAKQLLLPKVRNLFPPLESLSIVRVRAGLRASTPDHLPIIGQFEKKLFAITGMGSKGLLYHALYAKQLSTMILKMKDL